MDKSKIKSVPIYIWGAVAGLILAILFFTLGFFKTLILIILVLLGAYGASFLKQMGVLEIFRKNKE